MANLIPWKRLDKDAHYYNLADRLKNRYFDVDVLISCGSKVETENG